MPVKITCSSALRCCAQTVMTASLKVKKNFLGKRMETADILNLNMPVWKLQRYYRELDSSKWRSAQWLAREVEMALVILCHDEKKSDPDDQRPPLRRLNASFFA